MNLYLSTCHLLALLESPLSLSDFQEQAGHNLLFRQGCASIGQCLWFLNDEGIVSYEQERFQLSQMGLILYTHLLEWTQRDKQKIKQTRKSHLKSTPEDAVSPICPACRQRQCALYILSILIERLYSGLATRKQWQPGEAELIEATLQSYTKEQQALYLLAECHPLSDWLETEQLRLKKALREQIPEVGQTEWESILSQFSQPHSLKALPEIAVPLCWVSRLQLDYGLLPAQQLKTLRALASPYLYRCLDKDLPELEPAVFLRLARPALSADLNWAYLPVRINDRQELLIWQVQADQSWQLLKTLSLSEHENV